MKRNLAKKNILQILIFLGIIAVLISAYRQYVGPYRQESARQKQDQEKIDKIDILNGILSSLTASSTKFGGESHTVYLSLPANKPDCSDFSLPALGDGWKYHCAQAADYLKTDGHGWLPFNIADKMDALPVLNSEEAGSNDYYAYTVGAPGEYSLAAKLNSQKLIKEQAVDNGGFQGFRYEVGSTPSLLEKAEGVVGYWPINEGESNVIYDQNGLSGGTIVGAANWQKGGFLKFGDNDEKTFIYLASNAEINKLGAPGVSYSLSFWIKDPQKKNQSITEKWINSDKYPWAVRIENDNIIFAIYDGKNWAGAYANADNLYDGNWHQVVCVKNTSAKSLSIYIDKNLVGATYSDLSSDTSNSNDFTIGSRDDKGGYGFSGLISRFQLFSLPLASQELSALFDQQKADFLEN